MGGVPDHLIQNTEIQFIWEGGIKSSQWIQISVFSFFLRGGIIIIGRGTSKMVQMADGSFVRRGKNKNIYR